MTDYLRNLPPEILIIILSQLPIPSLLSFGATSRTNYAYHSVCMKRLHLAVFQKRIHAIISFLEAGAPGTEPLVVDEAHREVDEAEPSHHVRVLLPQSSRGKETLGFRSSPMRGGRGWRRVVGGEDERLYLPQQTIRAQNDVFARLVGRYGVSLVDLEFMAYDLDVKGAVALASSCRRRLRRLALRFEHRHIRDPMLPRNYWLEPVRGSTAWNALIGVGVGVGGCGSQAGLTGLETLILERAGITPWQLRMLVRRNPRLRDLRLKTCRAVQPEFLNWLGGIEKDPEEEEEEVVTAAPGANLEVLWLENCDGVMSKGVGAAENHAEVSYIGLEWVTGLKRLKSLSFRYCSHVRSDVVEQANKTVWHIPEVILPHSLEEAPPTAHDGEALVEIDPRYVTDRSRTGETTL
ncbi:hypothetical protein VTN02DRAFT_483 [Thermoascus thermophilus]